MAHASDASAARCASLLSRGLAQQGARVLTGGLGASHKHAAAARSFEAAGRLHVRHGRWSAAADAFVLAAEAEARRGSGGVRARAALLVTAGDARARVDGSGGARHWLEASELYASEAPVAAAAAAHRAADVYRADGALEEAAAAYSCASELYTSGAPSEIGPAARCMHAAGESLALAGDAEGAAARFTSAAAVARSENLLRHGAWDCALSAGVAALAAQGAAGAAASARAATAADAGFPTGRECRFLLDTAAAVRAGDLDALMDHAWNMDWVRPWAPYEIGCVGEWGAAAGELRVREVPETTHAPRPPPPAGCCERWQRAWAGRLLPGAWDHSPLTPAGGRPRPRTAGVFNLCKGVLAAVGGFPNRPWVFNNARRQRLITGSRRTLVDFRLRFRQENPGKCSAPCAANSTPCCVPAQSLDACTGPSPVVTRRRHAASARTRGAIQPTRCARVSRLRYLGYPPRCGGRRRCSDGSVAPAQRGGSSRAHARPPGSLRPCGHAR